MILTLCVQLSDYDGEDGYFYNTGAGEDDVAGAVRSAYEQHLEAQDDDDLEPTEVYVKRVFLGRFDGFNLVDANDEPTVASFL